MYMSQKSPMTCEGCYHSNTDGTNGTCQECDMCVRNPSVFSSRTLERQVNIEGVIFKAPMDLYITHDRKRLEDFLLMKRLQEIAIARKEPKPQIPDPIIYPYPDVYPYPNYPSPYWSSKWVKWWVQNNDDSGKYTSNDS